MKTSSSRLAADSVKFFGFYLYAVGAVLVFIPNPFLRLLAVPETHYLKCVVLQAI